MSCSDGNPDFIISPLSGLDQSSIRHVGMTYGFVFKSVDISALEDATRRAIDSWRLLAGRVEWNPQAELHQIRVPVSQTLPPDYESFRFTTSSFPSTKLELSTEPLHGYSAQVLQKPPMKYFRDKSTPDSIGAYASSGVPLLAIHVSVMQNCACVGVSLPHGVFDATGAGMVIQCINAALHGLEWTPPLLTPSNMMAEELKRLREAEVIGGTDFEAAVKEVQKAWAVPISIGSIVPYVVSIAYEFLWQRSYTATVYFGPGIIERLVEIAKQESEKEEGENVSKGDILVAWLLKAAYSNEEADASNPIEISISSILSIRRILTSVDPSFEKYPHNATVYFNPPSINTKIISSMSLYSLALHFRQAHVKIRTPSYIQAMENWLQPLGRNVCPVRRRGLHDWFFTNQVIAGTNRLDLGSEQLGTCMWMTPFQPDHTMVINRSRDGYTIEGSMRASQWRAIETALDELRNGAGASI